jgi:DNA invertase Pin-like site-specific DNA recombinase
MYAYVRVSTRDQNEDRQVIAMREQGIPKKNIIIEKWSGKDFNRPKYRKLVRRMKKDDILFVKSIDRLGRNYNEVIEQWRLLVKEREWTSWCWICLYWIPEGERICWGPS